MYIFLGIVGELATIIGSAAIGVNGVLDSILEISNNGYKVDKKTFDEIQKKQEKEKQKKNNGIKKLLNVLFILIPGVNLINASIKSIKFKKTIMNDIMNDPEFKQAFIPMTDKEKEQYAEYAKLGSKMQKLGFTAFLLDNEDEEKEFFGFIGQQPLVVDHGLTTLYYEELLPLAYTFDEVKRLNEATTYSYRIGKINDKNVAIIGIPNPDSPVSRIDFKKEDYKVTHTYEKITEEEAKNKTFAVYPFTTHNEEEVQKIIEEIKQSRINNTAKANLKTLQVQPTFEQDYISTLNEEVLTEEQQGPVLKRTLSPKRK